MERKDSQCNMRLYVLGSLLALALVVYIGVLYDIQINQHDYYLARSIRTITQEETVEASRGVITDRSGREMVSSRSSYNLTFDSSALDEGEDENEAILRLVKLCQSQGVAWVDNLPITKTAPFSYTFTSLTTSPPWAFPPTPWWSGCGRNSRFPSPSASTRPAASSACSMSCPSAS